MAVFLVRAGAHGEQEELALAQGISVLGWSDLSDLSGVASREELQRLCANAYPDAAANLDHRARRAKGAVELIGGIGNQVRTRSRNVGGEETNP